MPIPISDATHINTLLVYIMGRTRPGCGPVTIDEATAAARQLAAKANKALSAGLTPDDVDLTRLLALSPHNGAPLAEIDGMPVRAAFPTPPPGDDSIEHWTVILAEPPGPDGSMYRLCRVRRAGAPGEWEVIDSLAGAEESAWLVLGDLVHDQHAGEASDLNNAGLLAQIAYLVQRMGPDQVQAALHGAAAAG